MDGYTYVIKAIPGREVLQKNYVKLPERASQYSGRVVSLNERFSIIERGYYLEPSDSKEIEKRNVVGVMAEQPSRNEFVRQLEKLTEKLKIKAANGTLSPSRTCDSACDSADSACVSPTQDSQTGDSADSTRGSPAPNSQTDSSVAESP